MVSGGLFGEYCVSCAMVSHGAVIMVLVGPDSCNSTT